jgi:hypothetical protein
MNRTPTDLAKQSGYVMMIKMLEDAEKRQKGFFGILPGNAG